MKSTRVTKNPYAKTKKPDEVGQKRIRPWESNSASSNSTRHPSVACSSPLQNSSVSAVMCKGTSNDDSFDCGIDWDEALKTLESQSVFDPKPVASAIRPTTAPPKDAAPPFLSSSLAARTHPRGTACFKGATNLPFQPQLKENNDTSSEVNVRASALETLRPPAWNATTSCASTHTVSNMAQAQPTGILSRSNSITSESPCDPDQEGLPSALRFTAKDVAPVRDEHQKDLVKNANVGAQLLNGWQLYNHQKRAVLKALTMRRCILALDMGLGKTLIGCVWAKAFQQTMRTHVVVLCPVSLQQEWKRTMENTVGLVVQELAGTSKKKARKEKDNGETSRTPSVSIHSWSKIPDSIAENHGDFVVIADEAHSIQSMTSGRTKDTLKLVSNRFCQGVLLLTGTPMKNGKPSNLFPLLRAVNHPLGRHQKAYEARFCCGRDVNFGRGPVWQANGAANLEQLRKLTKSHMLHLTKESCLKDLPPLSRTFVKVPVSSRRQMQHNQALQEMAKIYENRERGSDERILGAVQNVRQVGSKAKVEAAVEQAKQILMEDPAVVIFTTFQDVAKQVHGQLAAAGWKGEILTGETPPNKRQAMVDNFQKGLSPVFCATFGAGGVGLTLTAANHIILVDRPWTPGDAHQAEDRVRRIGQTKPVKSIWLRAFDLDEQIDAIIEQKKQTTAAVLSESSNGSGEQQSALRLSIFQMLRSILPANNDGLKQTSILKFSQG